MTIDYSKIKPGDVVGVAVLEVQPESGCFRIEPGPMYTRTWIHSSAIVSHTPAPLPSLKVGDRVKGLNSGLDREIAWIEGGYVYLRPVAGDAMPPYILSEVEAWGRV